MEFYVMGLILKVLVWSPNKQYLVMLSLSVAEISVEEEALVARFLCTETPVVLNKYKVQSPIFYRETLTSECS